MPITRVSKQWWEQDVLDLDRIQTAPQEAKQTEGYGGDRRDDDRYGLNRWEDTLENVILGTEPNAPIASAPGL